MRFSAACAVFLTHLLTISGISTGILAHFGHDAVVVFFVLSGYVISYTVDSRDRDVVSYSINRMARLWSVMVPALVLTVVLDFVGSQFHDDYFASYGTPQNYSLIPIFVNALFLNQLWFLNVSPWSNSPFWSLGFEFWYYVLYGCLAFSRGNLRAVLSIACLLIMGPKIIIMLPIWLLGVAVHRYYRPMTEFFGWVLFVGSVVAYFFYRYFDVSVILSKKIVSSFGISEEYWGMAAYFPSDYIVAIFCAANFYGFRCIEMRVGNAILVFERTIRICAGLTFSIYLYHAPLLNLFTAFLPKSSLLIPILTLLIVISIGLVTESKKQFVRNILVRVI